MSATADRSTAGAASRAAGPGGGVVRGEAVPSLWLRPILRSDTLRAQLLSGLAALLFIALLAIATALLLWLPSGPRPGELLLGLVGLVVADVAVVLLFGDYLLRRDFVRPVGRMAEGAEAVASGDFRQRLEVTGPDELRRLAASLNRMADRLIRNQELLAENVRSLNETNRALTEARNELIQAEKLASVGRLAAGIAHEVGNPLGAILGYVEVAQRRGAAGGEWLQEIRREAERVDRILRGLLDFARPRAARSGTVEVNGLVREAVELLRTQGRLRDLSLRLELSPSEPAVRGDPHQLEQVLVNLLLNAADAIQAAGAADGAVTVRTRAETYTGPSLSGQPARRRDDPEGVDYSHLRRFRSAPTLRAPRLRSGDRVVRIEVIDNGVGLDPETAAQIFEPFFTTKEPGRGTGLGLAVSARLVEGMGGAITAEPTGERGARFSVLLPSVSRVEGSGRERGEG